MCPSVWPAYLSRPLAGTGLRSPFSLVPRLQTDQVHAQIGTVFEKPLLDHLNGELCPQPQCGPSCALLSHTTPGFKGQESGLWNPATCEPVLAHLFSNCMIAAKFFPLPNPQLSLL